jgi:alkylation response protein AidB-like acyl-CoA dehydrogenase
MDLDFTPQEMAFRDEVRAFLATSLTPFLRDGAAMSPGVFVEPDIGQAWNAALQAKGWLAYQWPEKAGGPGWSPVQRYIFEKECAVAGAPNLTVLGLKLVGPVIYTYGTQAQKEFYLPRILSGEDYWCQGFSEPESGSDLASLQCRAERQGDTYIINGSKIWTTHAHHANRIFCLVRTDPTARRQAGISFLLIDMHQPGVRIRPILTLAGDHEVNQVFFDNAQAPVSALVGDEGQGWAIAKFLLENERGGSCFAPRLLASLDRLNIAARDTPGGTGGLLADQLDWKRRVAKLTLSARALEMIELRILADIAKSRPPGPQTSLAKMLVSTLTQEIDLLALDLHGDLGLQLNAARPLYGDNAPPPVGSRDAQIAAPRYLNSRAWTIFGGTNEVQAGIIAKTVLEL